MNRMKGMTTQERMEDISRRAGLSIDICRRVLNAESESIVESLKKGERASLIGRVTLRPELRQKLMVGGNIEKFIKVKPEISSSLAAQLDGVKEFTSSDNDKEEDNGIRLRQIQSLL